MRIKLNIPEYSVKEDSQYLSDVFKNGRQFPILSIGRDSYIEDVSVDTVIDKECIYNVQVGRYTSIASDISFVVDLNHDYKRFAQGRISGLDYKRPTRIKRKGQILIMNDCWIGEHVTIVSGVTVGNGSVVASGAVVTKDVPPYSIVAGNPAKVIGYRFEKDIIEKLNKIRWWNWCKESVIEAGDLLYESIEVFANKHYYDAIKDMENVCPVDILPIHKNNNGEEKTILYVPDFEQQYPTYINVIDNFVKTYSNTNYELLLYIKEDEIISDKLEVLDKIFSKYENENCYVNIFVGDITDLKTIMCQVDYYVTNRSVDNIQYVDAAILYNVTVISGVDKPVFNSGFENDKMVKNREDEKYSETIKSLVSIIKNQNLTIDQLKNEMQENLNNVYKAIGQLGNNQVGLNATFGNFKYEMYGNNEELKYPIIESSEKAIDLIVNEGKSMSRFGDGEFAIIAGINRQKFQRADGRLAKRLKEVLKTNNSNILIGLMNVYGDLSKYNDECKYNVRAYLTPNVRKEQYEIIDMEKVYYDAYVTRPYASYVDNCTDAPRKRFDNLKRIWQDRKILIIEGEKTRMGVGNDLFDNAKDIVRILGPAEHAFDRYDEILGEALKQEKDRLVLIAMGATATVLAYDLMNAGFQAIDIGHVDIEYEWMKAGTGKKTEIPHKYNNEVVGGDNVCEINDYKYEDQVINRFV